MSTGQLPPPNPAYTPGEQLLGIFSASGGASINCAIRNQGGLTGPLFQSDFDEYRAELLNIIPGTTATDMLARVTTDGGATYISSASYIYAAGYHASGGTSGTTSNTGPGKTYIGIIDIISNNANYGVCGHIVFYNPLNSSLFTVATGQGTVFTNASLLVGWASSGVYQATTPVNGFQVLPSAGTVTGTILVYGKAKSAVVASPLGGASGKIVQVVNFETGALATGTTTSPIDDTIPQITEGTEFMTCTITPTNATNKLRIDVTVIMSTSASGRWLTAALFQDSTANALACALQFYGTASTPFTINFTHYMAAGTISPTTFRVRCGPDSGATFTFNGVSGGRLFGGTMASSITITEIVP